MFGQILRRVRATITSCRGKLRRVEAKYVMSRQITSCEANYGVSKGRLHQRRRGEARRCAARFLEIDRQF